MTPVEVEVIMPMLTTLDFGCKMCGIVLNQLETRKNYVVTCSSEYPEEWKEDLEKLSDSLGHIAGLYKHRIRIRIIDAQSPMGVWKQIRHRLRRLPAFVVDRKAACTGWDTTKLEALIDEQIREASRRFEETVRARTGDNV